MKYALGLLFAVSSLAQVVEEGGLTSATATVAGAAGKGTGKALSTVFSKVEKSLSGAAQTQSAVPTAGAVVTEKPAPPVKLPEVALITAGMTREDLIAKFGAPSQKITIPEGTHLTERYRYDVDKETVRVILEDGKVKEATSTRPALPQEKP